MKLRELMNEEGYGGEGTPWDSNEEPGVSSELGGTNYDVRLYPDENGEPIFRITNEQGYREFIQDADFDSVEHFERETGIGGADDLINMGWFTLINNRVQSV